MKTIRSRSLILSLACIGLLAAGWLPAAPAMAATEPVITGIKVVSWQGGPFAGSPDLLVDGSGLTQLDMSGLHAPSNNFNAMRSPGPGKPIIDQIVGVIDLQGAYKVASGGVWQYNASDPSIVAGARIVTFKTSMDGVNFASVPGATVDLAQGILGAPTAASVVSFSASARYVMVESTGFYGDYWGLSEVMFTGAPLPVPEPASFGLMGAGLVLLGAWRRRAIDRAAAEANQRFN